MQANKGEWSELYALFAIFANHKVPAADKNLDPIGDQYEFLQVLREDIPGQLRIYDLEQDGVILISEQVGQVIKAIPVGSLPEKTKKLFEKIKAAHESSFAIPEASELMNEFELKKIKASPSSKSDLVATIKDKISSRQQLGFSIKSQVGNPATLLNASQHTNFVYKVEDFEGSIEEINRIDSKKKIQERLMRIEEMGGKYVFSHIESNIFTENLQIVDTLFPGILAELLLRYYFGEGNTVQELADLVGEANGYNLSKKIVVYKMKEFLKIIALGMVPSKEWNTYISAQGGYLIVREDGQLVCYHLYNHDEFKDYLFENTKFDTPSSSRHGFGEIYQENGEYFIKLNLQIRFIK